ncbi:hypothetical protein M422DRAFT_267476 [Sphaerobolus stellatus SS14]|uniref:Uncharacterized protein n=1 Tax=Sphaerobolus stellatus (strain SS14) TaxID=990650 RepID=A0A0C9V0P1_SPHS4|nr:hypothetical protein M422DRAFT_267476 [Sphaerobolus stellatus SS14]
MAATSNSRNSSQLIQNTPEGGCHEGLRGSPSISSITFRLSKGQGVIEIMGAMLLEQPWSSTLVAHSLLNIPVLSSHMAINTRSQKKAANNVAKVAKVAEVPVVEVALPQDLSSLSIIQLDALAYNIKNTNLKALQQTARDTHSKVPRKLSPKWTCTQLEVVLAELHRRNLREVDEEDRATRLPSSVAIKLDTHPWTTKMPQASKPMPAGIAADSPESSDNDQDADSTFAPFPARSTHSARATLPPDSTLAEHDLPFSGSSPSYKRISRGGSLASINAMNLDNFVDDVEAPPARASKAKDGVRPGELSKEGVLRAQALGEKHAKEIAELAEELHASSYTVHCNMGYDERESRITSFWNKFQAVFWVKEHDKVEEERERQLAAGEKVTAKVDVEEAFLRCIAEYGPLKKPKCMTEEKLQELECKRKPFEDAFDEMMDPKKKKYVHGDTIRALKQVRKILTSLAVWWAARGVGIAGWAVSLDPIDPTASAANFTFAGDEAGREFFEDKDVNMMMLLRDFETSCRFRNMEAREHDVASREHTYLSVKDDTDSRKKTVSAMLRQMWATVMNKDKCARLAGQKIHHGLQGLIHGEQLNENGREIQVEKWDEGLYLNLASLAAVNGLSKEAILASDSCSDIALVVSRRVEEAEKVQGESLEKRRKGVACLVTVKAEDHLGQPVGGNDTVDGDNTVPSDKDSSDPPKKKRKAQDVVDEPHVKKSKASETTNDEARSTSAETKARPKPRAVNKGCKVVASATVEAEDEGDSNSMFNILFEVYTLT